MDVLMRIEATVAAVICVSHGHTEVDSIWSKDQINIVMDSPQSGLREENN